jgi:hypothetical protein
MNYTVSKFIYTVYLISNTLVSKVHLSDTKNIVTRGSSGIISDIVIGYDMTTT